MPLSRVATIRYDTGASFIYRENYRRYIPIKFGVVSKDLGGTVAKAQKEAEKVKLPEGYYMRWSGIFNEMKAAFLRFYYLNSIGDFSHSYSALHILRQYEKRAAYHCCSHLYGFRRTHQSYW